MASNRGPRAHEQPLASTERRQVSKACGRWLVSLACCRGVSAAGETPSFDPILAVQCREPVIAARHPRSQGGRQNLPPHPPSAFNLPAPPTPAVAQLTSSWGKDGSAPVASPEAQGVRETRPEATLFCRYGRLCCPTSPSREVKEGGQCRA